MLSYPIKPDIFPKNDRFILFYFGGIGERRGIITCFDAIKILSEEIPSIHLLLIGPVDGQEQKTFDRYLNDPELKEKVTHYKWKDLGDFPSYTYASDICLSPIYKDDQHESGVANKVFQYMLFGKPLIVSDCDPQIEIVEGSKCGTVFINKDAVDLALKIKYLYNNPELRKEMGENGKKAVFEKYNLEVCGKQLKLLYNSFAG
jgi:glycosyltransferase involved in cell wall biosynthesis